ncbi:ABC transporter ATP-binding protein [Dictyobacter alpinus]|uniref:ABC transporter ATP-binding protein n=1 Tax=Dictyobacter alpinus TaxID=2014873 RepID=A0A402BJI5_9CHLR|nr:ATP-binding cassette domain-containing protein [Dictyobacter alpinus]GCE31496.1 ABC transporter ATP-binding protein [Dictyobacter alpinus]
MSQNSLVIPEIISKQAVVTTPIIRVDKLVKRYKKAEKNAVDQISLEVPAGTLFALLGPNGAGKTTAISILTTTLAATSGTVQIAGYDLATQAHLVRRKIGIIFQRPSLDLNLTAEENIRLHVNLYGLYPYRPAFRWMPRAYRTQVQEMAALLEIEESLFKPVKTFSGGMKRKLEIVRSLLHRPEVLFLDEPTTGLDPASRRSLWDHLRRVRAESGTTVFLTTHYLEEAEGADQVCIMNHGRIISAGTPQQIKADLAPSTLTINAEDRDRLRAELQRLGQPFKDGPQFALDIENEQVHQLLQQIQTPLNLVQTSALSLEDAYLRIIQQD